MPSDPSWELKLASLSELSQVDIRMVEPGEWVADMIEAHFATSSGIITAFGKGETPQDAIVTLWRVATEPSGTIVILNAHKRRSHWTWSETVGWVELPIDDPLSRKRKLPC